jgi:hypothetical protein
MTKRTLAQTLVRDFIINRYPYSNGHLKTVPQTHE